ncbi:MAG TPA: TIGR03000 domain-containing protein [Gemmataceae bacterium]|nr:TIGR03000 domain-containing protein [Gemmataceae bacterium]
MFRQWFRAGGAALVLGVAGMLLTAGTSRAQVFNTVAVNTPYGFTFYTFPANYYPSFIPMYPAWYGYPNIGLTPYYYPYGSYATTFDMMPPPRKGTPQKIPRAVVSAPSASDKTAAIDIRTPADARVWIQGKETMQKGAVRRFVSPPLNSGQTYTYDVRVSWTRGGKQVTQDRRLQVRAGDRQSVLVLAAPASSQVAGTPKMPAIR